MVDLNVSYSECIPAKFPDIQLSHIDFTNCANYLTSTHMVDIIIL